MEKSSLKMLNVQCVLWPRNAIFLIRYHSCAVFQNINIKSRNYD